MKKYYNQIGMFISVVMVALVVGLGGYYLYHYVTLDSIVIDSDEKDNPVFIPEEDVDKDVVSGVDGFHEPVVVVEKFRLPFAVDAKMVKPYFDYSKDLATQVSAVTLFENVYRPNMGIDYASNNKAFNVTSVLSGAVSQVYDDPIFGSTVVITSENGYVITYSSLDGVVVSPNNTIKQGDLIGVASENVYNPELQKHVHVEVSKNGTYMNLESLINKPVR